MAFSRAQLYVLSPALAFMSLAKPEADMALILRVLLFIVCLEAVLIAVSLGIGFAAKRDRAERQAIAIDFRSHEHGILRHSHLRARLRRLGARLRDDIHGRLLDHAVDDRDIPRERGAPQREGRDPERLQDAAPLVDRRGPAPRSFRRRSARAVHEDDRYAGRLGDSARAHSPRHAAREHLRSNRPRGARASRDERPIFR